MQTADQDRLIELEGVVNLRDVGGYPAGEGRRTRYGRLLRSASVHGLSEAGKQQLIERGLRHVIDLRHDHETQQSPNTFADSEAVRYVNVSLFAGLAPDRVPIGVIPTLTEMYIEILDSSRDQIREAVLPFADEGAGLVHCTAGKDRTGIIVALLLDLAGVDRETITHDYALTDVYLEPMRDAFREHARTAGIDMVQYEHMISCQPDYITAFLDHLTERYGGAEAYLLKAGLSAREVAAIRDNLTEPA